MSPLSVITNLGLDSWEIIYLGFRSKWIDREDVFEYAMSLLLAGCENEDVAIIAGGEYLSDEQLAKFVCKHMDIASCSADVDSWRLGFLVCIDKSNESEENKIARLQEVYSDFNYPEDMVYCSVYHPTGGDPLLAMREVIEVLKEKLLQ